MTQTITTDLSGLQDVLRKVAGDIPAAIEKGLDKGGAELMAARRLEIRKTYGGKNRRSQYTYTDENGHKVTRKWTRTGALQAGQNINSKPGIRELTMEGPAGEPITNYPGGYSEKLATLPVSKDGKSRANPYAKNATESVEPRLQRGIELEIANALGLDTTGF